MKNLITEIKESEDSMSSDAKKDEDEMKEKFGDFNMKKSSAHF